MRMAYEELAVVLFVEMRRCFAAITLLRIKFGDCARRPRRARAIIYGDVLYQFITYIISEVQARIQQTLPEECTPEK